MREILFRGKRTDNGEWITDSETFILDGDGAWLSDEMHVEKIAQETIGQYTGLTDKNGVKIFEGDIVIHHNRSDDDIGYVYFSAEDCRYKRTSVSGKDVCVHQNCCYEVIGNIHDNPELVGGDINA